MTEPGLLWLFVGMGEARDGITHRAEDRNGEADALETLRADLADMELAARKGVPPTARAIALVRRAMADVVDKLRASAIAEGVASTVLHELILKAKADAPTMRIDLAEYTDANADADAEEVIRTLRRQLASHGHKATSCTVCAEEL